MIGPFEGDYRFLSNFAHSPIKFDGFVYPSVEHAYQAAKTLDSKEREEIRRAPSAGKAKRKGRKVTLRSDWEEIKIKVMLDLLRLKFRNPNLKQKLFNTGIGDLIEINTWGDRFWGMCHKVKQDGVEKLEGKNMLGNLLMLVREELIVEKKGLEGSTVKVAAIMGILMPYIKET